MPEDSGGTRQSPGPLSSGQGSEGGVWEPEGWSLAGWSWGGGGERVEGSFLGMCEAVRHQVAFRHQRKGEAGLGGPRGVGRAWAGPPAALVAPRNPVGEGVLLNRRKAYSQVMTWYRVSVGTTCRSAEVRTVAEP